MPKFIDRVGYEYGKLCVLAHAGLTRHHNWFCVCTCGTFCVVDGCDLATGNTVSCGCLWGERVVKHGSGGKRSFHIWKGMLRRCTNPKDKDYPKYGAVGIKVNVRWLQYEHFVADMGEPPDGMTLDREQPYGDYTLENCRWATATTQARNIRTPKRNTTGYVGVSRAGGGWRASVTVQKRKHGTRVLSTLREAIAARKQLEQLHWGAA